MIKYKLEVKIDSEAIFNSGESDGNIVQMKVLTDEDGFVYYHSKTLKGQLKDVALWIYKEYKKLDDKKAKRFIEIVCELFGFNKEEYEYHQIDTTIKLYELGKLKVGHLELDEETKDFFYKWFEVEKDKSYITLSKHELIQAQTKIRTNISIVDGVVKKGGLVNFHTVRQGLTFYSTIEVDDTVVDEKEITEVLKLITGGFKRIGANAHRGRGCITAEIINVSGMGA